MKIQAPTRAVLDAVQMAERLVGKKESLPVLSCVLFDVRTECAVRATNLESAIDVRVPCTISTGGSIAVPAAVLSQTLRSIGGEHVTLSLEEGNLLVEARGTKTLIKSIPHDEFPVLPAEGKGERISLSREKFLRSLQAVSYAASPSMIRADLGSVYVAVRDGSLVAVATDSFRLAEKNISQVGAKSEIELLIPLRHTNELTHVLERISDESVSIGVDDSQMTVMGGGVRFVCRVVDARFPNYKEIVPKAFVTEATILKSDLAELLRKARVFSGSEMHVGFHIYPKRKVFTATARSNNIGEMSDSVDAALSGEDMDINFHIGYVGECLSSIESDSVTLGFAGPGRPLVIRGVSDQSFMYLVMPLNR